MLVSGTAGTGKTSVAAALARAACENGERCVYLAFEESAAHLTRNMRSIGIDLERYVKNRTLRLIPIRPSSQGLEMHLLAIHKAARSFDPAVVVMDRRDGARRERGQGSRRRLRGVDPPS